MEKKQTPKTPPPKNFSQSLCKEDSMLELSLSTINTTLFISDKEVFISKAAKNDLMYVRTFRAPNC